jgi:hypothetical protein
LIEGDEPRLVLEPARGTPRIRAAACRHGATMTVRR